MFPWRNGGDGLFLLVDIMYIIGIRQLHHTSRRQFDRQAGRHRLIGAFASARP